MLKIRKIQNGELLFKLIGRMDAENIGEFKALLDTKTTERRIVLDLEDLTLVDQEVVSFLIRCEADGIELRNCPAYIREWINGER
jgi:anti-anti-sigma regulatory factor